MDSLKVDAIATGHYAKTSFGTFLEHYNASKGIKINLNKKYSSNFFSIVGVRLLLAKDVRKDQTFFLSQVKQENLHKVMFPLGDLTKSEVKRIAIQSDLTKIAMKPESMGICFIGSRHFQDFIEEVN